MLTTGYIISQPLRTLISAKFTRWALPAGASWINSNSSSFSCCAERLLWDAKNQYYQYRAEFLDRGAYAGYETTIKEQIAAFPGIRAMWQLVRHSYSKDFVAFMDDKILALPAHESQSAFEKWQALVENQSRKMERAE